MSFFSIIFLQDAKQFLDLNDYDVEDIEYEFKPLENSSFDEIAVIANDEQKNVNILLNLEVSQCLQQIVLEIQKIGYTPVIENVTSQNGLISK